MFYKNIMVAFDGSEPSKEALIVAKNLIGDDASAVMHIVSVIPVGSLGIDGDSSVSPIPSMQQIFPDMDTYESVITTAKESAKDNIHDAIDEELSDMQCAITVDAVVSVKPANGICEYAEDHHVDMIVMGRRGLGALRAMLGSVSYAVLHETSIPVVTVK